ncbi:MAG: D-alanine--D-alanine ligase [Bacteroides sp.]|nr:D-alanine--D-alanine ligase [Bacteroides sp.]MCM1549579.1 D-alanine--D-alanine ligase [Clostridium sp.]
MAKKTIAVLFGGQSSEHEISCLSAATVVNAIDTSVYNVVMIGITREGHWLLTDSVESIQNGTWNKGSVSAVISPDATRKEIICMERDGAHVIPVDVVFPVLHGRKGEDGTVQGLLELAELPYVGCGVLASALGMDKLYTKLVVERLGIAQASYVPVMHFDFHDMPAVITGIERQLSYPVFVKPSNAGSSKGISKAHNRQELEEALQKAAEHDEKLLVEETILGRELECAVLGGRAARASGIGEILTVAEFYDYDAKYHDTASRTVIHPELPEGKTEEIQQAAVRIFQALDGYGLSRVDFFLEQGTNRVVFNEINTLPGFTGISMYPMLWKAMGMDMNTIVARQIALAYERRG